MKDLPGIRLPLGLFCSASLAAAALVPAGVVAAEVDPRPPDRLTVVGNASTLTGTDGGAGGSLSWLHHATPDAIFGLSGEYQYIEDSSWNFATVRGSLSAGQSPNRFTVFGEMQYGKGDDDGRDFDYAVAVLGLGKVFTSKVSGQIEARYIDIDTTYGTLPKLSLSYLWTRQLLTTVSYAYSIGGNLGTELVTARIDYFGPHMNILAGGAFGSADSTVVIPGVSLPATDLRQAFIGVGKVFKRGEFQVVADFLELDASEKTTFIVSFTAYVGSRAR
jgi:hypothetical protein